MQKCIQLWLEFLTTIDSEDVGYVCNLPDAFKKEGLNVRFSGEYRAYDQVPKTMLGGQTFYYLKVSQMKKMQ
ncbi:hypothetical protein [Siphonobacter sp. BAB-5405]|uniref:hypothetical protein n=1 Tax=Siphonobacter sp. BAB-5405 TaxID=1864825 RepID=UPI0011AFC7C4|nr:hypothetical protein [Siphonobacter sp. BAB-5405]